MECLDKNPFQHFPIIGNGWFTQSWEAVTEEESQVANLLLKTIASKLESHGLFFLSAVPDIRNQFFSKRVSWNWYQVWEIGTVHKDCGNFKSHQLRSTYIYAVAWCSYSLGKGPGHGSVFSGGSILHHLPRGSLGFWDSSAPHWATKLHHPQLYWWMLVSHHIISPYRPLPSPPGTHLSVPSASAQSNRLILVGRDSWVGDDPTSQCWAEPANWSFHISEEMHPTSILAASRAEWTPFLTFREQQGLQV